MTRIDRPEDCVCKGTLRRLPYPQHPGESLIAAQAHAVPVQRQSKEPELLRHLAGHLYRVCTELPTATVEKASRTASVHSRDLVISSLLSNLDRQRGRSDVPLRYWAVAGKCPRLMSRGSDVGRTLCPLADRVLSWIVPWWRMRPDDRTCCRTCGCSLA